MLIKKVLPAIVEKWPGNHDCIIEVQQDNAKPHIKDNDAEWRVAVEATGWNIRLTQQPPNSLDLNVLDLGLFSAIQSKQY